MFAMPTVDGLVLRSMKFSMALVLLLVLEGGHLSHLDVIVRSALWTFGV